MSKGTRNKKNKKKERENKTMMNAKETRKTMEAKIEERKQAMIKESEKYIVNEIAPNIKRTAESGYEYCILEKKHDIAYDYIFEKLTELGYKVRVESRNIRISW